MPKQARERFVRFVFMKVKPKKVGELRKVFRRKIAPRMRRIKGIRRVYLSQLSNTPNELVSISYWNAKRDADAYQKSGSYMENVGMVRPLLSKNITLKSYNVVEHTVGIQVKKKRK